MKACIIQPFYSVDYSRTDELFQEELRLLEQCDESMDLIVLPEACDVPCLARTREEFISSCNKYGPILLEKCAETARRCEAVLFVNATRVLPTGERNTTYAFNKRGEIVGTYYKQHLTPGEVNHRKLDSEYTFDFSEPTVITIDGVRYGFLTCYDFYFYESFANIARNRVDVIIGCSHQRSDRLDAIELISRFCAYNCNAYVVRASVSLDEQSDIGGGSMIVGPDGRVLVNMGNRVGMETAEFSPTDKYYKPAGFGNPEAAHYTYIEAGRRPWKYRPAGSAISRPDKWLPLPRVCAHRGLHIVVPENSLPALGAAVAMGAEEIEFDVWSTKDGELVLVHDKSLERLSDGEGFVWEHTYEELLALDFGFKANEGFRGMKVSTLEEALKKLACHTVMNIHIKSPNNVDPWDEKNLEKLIGLIYKYDCQNHIYFMTGNDTVLRQLKNMAPDLKLCVGAGNDAWGIVDRAIAMGCPMVQLYKGKFDQAMIDKAHAHNIRCNVYWSNDEEEAIRFLEMGIDTILTDNYCHIAQAVKKWKEKH